MTLSLSLLLSILYKKFELYRRFKFKLKVVFVASPGVVVVVVMTLLLVVFLLASLLRARADATALAHREVAFAARITFVKSTV